MDQHRSSTRKMYYCVWRSFNEFFIRLDFKPTSWEDCLILFVGYLIKSKKKSSTIKSYISAIKAILMEDNIQINEDKYLLTSLTKACKYHNDRVCIRLPIQKGLSEIILRQVADYFGDQPYLSALYKAIFASAYYGLLRIGEMASGTHPVLATDVHVGENKNKILFILRTSKTHWKDKKPQHVRICSNNKSGKVVNYDTQVCPFHILNQYIETRPHGALSVTEPFFVFSDCTPVTPQ